MRAGDARDLAEKIAWLRDHPDDAERMGRNARALAEREFGRDELAGAGARRARGGGALTELSYCVVNTGGRDYLLDCLAAIERTHPEGVEHELLVLDNASEDGSAEAVRERHPDARLFALDRRQGKADNDSPLLKEARGRYCLLLNEDSELHDGATRALLDALEADPARGGGGRAAAHERRPSPRPARGASLTSPGRSRPRCSATTAWPCRARGDAVREVGWVQSSAHARAARRGEQVGWLDGDFFVYSDETDFCKRLHDAGWRILFVPGARAVHHDQLGTDAHGDEAPDRGVPPQPRPLLPQARSCASPGWCGRRAGPGPTSCGGRGGCCRGAIRAATCCTRARSSPAPRRGHPRSGGGTQPRGCPRSTLPPRHGAR